MPEPRTLLRIVEELEPSQVRILSRLVVTLNPDMTAAVRLTLAGGSPAATPATPEGVSAAAWRHLPDITYPLATETPIDEQIRALWRSGIVGELDAAMYRPLHADPAAELGIAHWHIVTHAGSNAERRAWVRSLGSGNLF